jgi:signal transduction histidine kinase
MGIWEWTQRTDRVRWSPEVGPMFGREAQPAEMPLALFLALVHPDDREELEFRILTAGREQGRLAATVRSANGGRWLRLDGAAVTPQAGPVRVVAVMADVTERMQLEEQVQQAAKLDALGAMAAGIAHDFNNMLTAIGGSAELARQAVEDVADERLRTSLIEDLDGVLRATAQARMLTSQLMTYSRREQPQPRTVALAGVVRELEPMLRRLLGVRVRLDVAIDDGADDAMVLADPRQLQQVVMNLVVNARDAMPNGGRVTVGVASTGTQAVLTVSDTGPGIPAEVLPRLFETFFTTKASGHGTGLGLATVYRIVVGAGGEVSAGNQPEGGARFTVRLPLHERARLSAAS